MDAALEYIERGFLPVPVPFKSKKPTLTGWQNLRIDKGNVGEFFNGKPQNIGILLCDSYGSTDVDLDAAECLLIADSFLPATGMIFGHASKPHSHRFYRSDPPQLSRQFADPCATRGQKGMLVELRCHSGKGIGMQTIVPPSVHESGEPIEFDQHCTRLPSNVEAKELNRAVALLATAAMLGRHWPPEGSRHNAFLALAGWLHRCGTAQEEIVKIHWGIYQILWRDAADLTACKKEIETTLAAAGNGTPFTAYQTLTTFLDKRLLYKAADWLGVQRITADKQATLPEIVNAEDLLAKGLSAPEPIIDQLLFPGITLLIGRPKVGKSWLALQTALSLITEKPLGGHFRTRRPARVLYFALEESQHRTASRIIRLIPEPCDGIRDLSFVYTLDSLREGGASQIDKLLSQSPAEVLIIDTLLAASRSSGRSKDIVRNDYAEIHLFREIVAKHGCAVILVHHSRKDSAQHDDVDAIIGTSGTSAAVDAIWHLKRGKANNALLLSTVGREIERELYEFTLDLDHGGLLFAASGTEANMSEQRSEIIELLEAEEKPMSPVTIATALGKNRGSIRRLLHKLYQDDIIRKSMKGLYFVGNFGTA